MQKQHNPKVWSNPVHFLAFGFGSGLAPKAPGTFGTLAAIPVFFGLSFLNIWAYLLITAAVCICGIWICGKTSKDMEVHDHSGIVWDEIAGYLITMIYIPNKLWCIALGFALFRFFDILKPWPISFLDKKIEGGLGIMLDDIAAGIFSLVIMQITIKIFL